jgi:Domain of Unknown Function (DUF928)
MTLGTRGLGSDRRIEWQKSSNQAIEFHPIRGCGDDGIYLINRRQFGKFIRKRLTGMKKHKQRQFLNLIPPLIFWEMIAMLSMPQLARSQTPSIDPVPTEIPAFEPPPDDGEPDHTAGGGSRNGGSCLSQNVAMTLTPASGDLAPSFSIALPPTSAHALVVKIEDENDNLVYYDTLAIEQSPKTLNFSLSETASSLEVGKHYKWTVSAICGEAIDPNDPTIEGLFTLTSRAEPSPVEID